jgi:hypothetical protein
VRWRAGLPAGVKLTLSHLDSAPHEGTRPTEAEVRACRPRALTRRLVV